MLKSHFVKVPQMSSCLLIILTALVHITYGQSYYLSLSHSSQTHYFSDQNSRESTLKPEQAQPVTQSPIQTQSNHNNFTASAYNDIFPAFSSVEDEEQNHRNTTIIIIKNIQRPHDLSQTTMDVITIIWYVATFAALAAFFLLMACSDRRCDDAQRNGANTNETSLPPPTPSPSYSEFAPPSYETVIKMQHDNDDKTGIFVIPFTVEGPNNKDNNNNNNNNSNNSTLQSNPTTPLPSPVDFYTINELQKISS